MAVWATLLQGLVNFDWWHQLPLSEKCIDFLHKLERRVLLVEDEGIDVVDDDRDLPLLEEELQLLPVVLLLRVVFGVIKRVHLDF